MQTSTLEVFDRGVWRDVLVSEDFAGALHAFQDNARETDKTTLFCGHWMLFVYALKDFVQQRDEDVPIAFVVEVFGMRDTERGSVGDFWIIQDILVRDFPSLLQLFALLRSADVEALSQEDTPQQNARR